MNLHQEPIIKEALYKIIMEMLSGLNGIKKVIISILSDISMEKSLKSEYFFQTYVALNVSSSPSGKITLDNLLLDLLPENQRHYIPICASGLYLCMQYAESDENK